MQLNLKSRDTWFGEETMCRKLMKKMKWTTAIILLANLSVAAKSKSQTLHVEKKEYTLRQVERLLDNQVGYLLTYNKKDIKEKKFLNSLSGDFSIQTFLSNLFKNQGISFSIKSKTIFLMDALNAESRNGSLQSGEMKMDYNEVQNILLKGQVVDSLGNPMESVTVHNNNSGKSVSSDREGNFEIPASIGDKVSFSFIGFIPRIFTVEGSFIKVVLHATYSSLDEMQIMAYGKTSKRLSTGNIATVTSKEIAEQPVTNVLQALAGRVPGVLISQNSGTPGAGISVQIRGVGSLMSGTNPLYIVDGVPYLSDAIYSEGGNTTSSMSPAYGSSPLNAINPSDIESISVLKDADATAIYGSRGSNGVILITTKKGVAGKTRFTINVSQGISGIADIHRVKPLSLDQYLEIRRAAYANSNATPTVTAAPDLTIWDTTGAQNTDFQKLLIGKTAQLTDASASFSGGSQTTAFLLSATYHKESTVVPGDNYYSRGAVHFSIQHTSLDKKFSASITNSMSWDKSDNPGRLFQASDLGGYSFTLAPNFPLYDTTGGLYWNSYSPFSPRFDNPLKYKYQSYTTKNNNMIGGINLRYSPVNGLDIKLNGSYNKLITNAISLNGSKSINPYSGDLPSAYFQENSSETWNIEPQVEYNGNMGVGKLDVLGGTTFQQNNYAQPYYIVGTNYTSDALLSNPQAAGNSYLYSYNSTYKYQSVFGRVNYNISNKYILNLNYRWDASSKFGKNDRYGSFGSVGGVWIFSEENWIKNHFSGLSYGKLRANYGSTGNDQIGNYQYMDTYSTYYYPYNGVNSIVPTQIANPYLKWEVNKKLEIAMDLGFFKDRILFSAAWFSNHTDNPLVSAPLTTITGFSSYTSNLDATYRQRGTEFTLTTVNIRNTDLEWRTNFNISFADTKLTRFNNFENSTYYYSSVLGNSLSSLYGFQYLGVDPGTHLPSFLDANKDGSYSYTEAYPAVNGGLGDYVYIGKTNPDFYGGLNNSIRYKSFQLDFLIQFVGHVTKPGIMASASNPGYNPVNMYEGVYDLFKETDGKIATRTFSYNDGSAYVSFVKYLQSNAVMSNAAYARLKNVSIAYNLPKSLASRMKMSDTQFYVHAQNLFTVTGYKGMDPETGSSFMPPMRTITFGTKLSF